MGGLFGNFGFGSGMGLGFGIIGSGSIFGFGFGSFFSFGGFGLKFMEFSDLVLFLVSVLGLKLLLVRELNEVEDFEI